MSKRLPNGHKDLYGCHVTLAGEHIHHHPDGGYRGGVPHLPQTNSALIVQELIFQPEANIDLELVYYTKLELLEKRAKAEQDASREARSAVRAAHLSRYDYTEVPAAEHRARVARQRVIAANAAVKAHIEAASSFTTTNN